MRTHLRYGKSSSISRHGVNFKLVGEIAGVEWMVVTQSAWFKGYKDMDDSLILQFEEGELEARARNLLETEGALFGLVRNTAT